MNVTKALSTNGLVKTFDGVEVIRHCSMHVEQGCVYGFLGANGAGKTTVFKMLIGLLAPTAGTAFILGLDMLEHREELQRRIGSVIEVPLFYDHLSAAENLEIHLAYMGLPTKGIPQALEAVGLHGSSAQPVAQYSLGMRQRLGIARAIIHEPELLILDEPINGLDPMGIRDMRKLFTELAHEKGMTIVLSSHILSEIEQIADVVGVLACGTVVEEVRLEEAHHNACQSASETSRHQNASQGLEEYFLSLMNGVIKNV